MGVATLRRSSFRTTGLPLALGQLIGDAAARSSLPPLREKLALGWASTTSRYPTHVDRRSSAEFVGYFMGDGSLHAVGSASA